MREGGGQEKRGQDIDQVAEKTRTTCAVADESEDEM